ncbi:hypothetical protein C0991_001295 [Blastosporella zonata]|nr:hypothetical protein C0991_001295 [Blastosporella zonata]
MFRTALARRPRAALPSLARWGRFNSNGQAIPPSGASTSKDEKLHQTQMDLEELAFGDKSFSELQQTLKNMSLDDLETVFKNPPRLAETEGEIFGHKYALIPLHGYTIVLTYSPSRILDNGRPARLDPHSLPTPPLDPSKPCTEEQYAASLVHGRGIHVPIYHKPTHGVPVANVQFRSHHPELLDLFTHFATHAASSLGIPCSQPVFLPQKRTLWTVPRSPFAHKKSQENFERIVYKRAVKAWDADPEVVERWFRYLRRHALGGVGMRQTKWERMPLSVGKERLASVDKLSKKQPLPAQNIKALGERIVAEELATQQKAKITQGIPLQN